MPSPRLRRAILGLASLAIAAAVWIPTAHLLWSEDLDRGLFGTERAELTARHVRTWTDEGRRAAELEVIRRGGNGEWDFMWRMFSAWALCNQALKDPATADAHLAAVDSILEDTMRLEREAGFRHFLLPYGRGRFLEKPEGSQFVDGEIALTLALRRLVREHDGHRAELRRRTDLMVARMERSPVLSAESYPDECWTFCNVIALAAVRIGDVLDGSDHSAFLRKWVETARSRLVEKTTGLLVSEYTLSGITLDGPEGSTIWMVAHMLDVVDRAFARDQYDRAKAALGRRFCGFAFSREWPEGLATGHDVDSGAVVPILDAGAGGSGMAFVGAASFGDRDYLKGLHAALSCAGMPIRAGGERRYASSNLVGDATILYAASLGPAWEEVRRREGKR